MTRIPPGTKRKKRGFGVANVTHRKGLRLGRGEPNSLSHMGRNGSSDRAGLERHGPRTRVASPSSAATLRSCTFPGGKYEERGGAVRAAAAAGAPRGLRRPIEEDRGHVRPEVGRKTNSFCSYG